MEVLTTSINSILKVIQKFNTLLDCPVRFSGEYDGRNVRDFIEYIECYKRIKCITDEQALQELQHLLIDQAHIWWLQSKENLSQWSEALSSLEYQYSKQYPAHIMFNNFNAVIQSEPMLIEEPVPEVDQVVPILEKDQEKDKHCRCNSDITHEMPILEKDQVDALCSGDEAHVVISDQVDPIKDVQRCAEMALTAKDFNICGEIPQSVIDQLIPMVNEALNNMSSHKSRINLLLQSPNAGRYRVILRKSGRNEIKAIIPKYVNSSNDVNLNNDREEPRKKQQFQKHIVNTDVNGKGNNEILHASEREPKIKVRRTEDLMPKIIDLDESATNEIKDELEQEKFVSDYVKTTITNTSHNSEETFQIDSDTISQINNMNESEMNAEALDNNQHTPRISSVLPDNVAAMAFLYSGGTTILPESLNSESPESHSKIHSTIKKSNRCRFCRNREHSYEICLKKIKHNEPFPDFVVTTASLKNSELLKEAEMKCSPSKDCDNEKSLLTPKISLTNTQSLLNNSPTTFNSTDNISSLLNNIPEKCINSLLTTKFIDPISGSSSNKLMAVKIRSPNVSVPKCHQCGTLGFYKSICPKCSPIYNNQNKQ